jgi:hypothetical protein
MPVRDEPLARRVRQDAAVRIGAVAALWLSVLPVTYWWMTDPGVQDLFGWVSGLVASVLLLVQVLLMARVPVLESAFGQDRLARATVSVGLPRSTFLRYRDKSFSSAVTGVESPVHHTPWWEASDDTMVTFMGDGADADAAAADPQVR